MGKTKLFEIFFPQGFSNQKKQINENALRIVMIYIQAGMGHFNDFKIKTCFLFKERGIILYY